LFSLWHDIETISSKNNVMMLFIVLLIVFLVGLGLFIGFAAKKEKKDETGLGDINAGNQRGPR
jgi:Na+-transporting methylmalonyl-CoA/oxaloacetate decarboxylase gamma subunit